MENLAGLRSFYAGRRVFLTGHTGFKGSWLCRWLLEMGAEVWGYALPPEPDGLFALLPWESGLHSTLGDIRDAAALNAAMQAARPEVVFHLAAQPLVRRGYEAPAESYAVNLMGTVHLLEAIRQTPTVRSAVLVTTDKVYAESERGAHREEDLLDGWDPYANSKSCAELAAGCWRRCFLGDRVALSTLRSGNVIGGGDFAPDRLLPDCIRAAIVGKPVRLRHPEAVRPYQHLLEPLAAYLTVACRQAEDRSLADSYNVAPLESSGISNGALAALFCDAWGEGMRWIAEPADFPHEAPLLRLDGSKLGRRLGWYPRWTLRRAVTETVAWTRVWQAGGDLVGEMRREIDAYERGMGA